MTGEAFESILDVAMRREAARQAASREAEFAAFEAEYALPPPRPRRQAHGVEAYRRAACAGLAGPALRTLGLDSSATRADVKRAYRRLAFDLHPDRGGRVSAFVALEEAYRTALRLVRDAA